ncbi:MAG: GH92 family glycosyl hydrolase [Bacteroidales bacterium]|nr:GH92 family glycosyl hydrolase [Bacteroidales bacterium]
MRKPICLSLALCLVLCITAQARDNSRFVNLFMGTAGDHGQVSPAAQLPLGLASVCPDSKVSSHAGYDYDEPEISGISVTRVSGVGGQGSGGNLRILPASGGTAVFIQKGTEKAVPGYYETRLDNGVQVRLTATNHCALEQYRFPRGVVPTLFVDFNSAIDPRRSRCRYAVLGSNDIEGWVVSSTVGNAGAYKLFFRLHTDKPFTVAASDSLSAQLLFPEGTHKVEVRIGLSSISEASAVEELDAIAARRFTRLRADAARDWRRVLGKVDVKGSTPEQRTLFYTGLYRVYLSPFHATFGGKYVGTDAVVREATDWTYYSGWSMWDTYRAKFPLITLLDPATTEDICRSLVSLYQTGKRNWATLQEPVPTVRTEHSQIALLDAWAKGIRGFDLAAAFPAMEAEADIGRAEGARQGLTRNSPDQKMETIYDLWAMGQIARIIGRDEAATRYLAESADLFEQTWKTDFMTITPEFAQMKGNGLYQGTRWQYRWAVPIYADKMIEWGGREQLADELSEFFRLQLFNQGNEPDIQTPFMFNLFGHPERTDALVHALLTDDNMVHRYGGNAEYPEPFVGRAFRNRPDGYAPEMDEDDGTMSAWYLFSQLGLYPVCLGTDRYELFTPLFEKAVLHLPNHDVRLIRKCAPASARQVMVDGIPLPDFSISHTQLTSAREIVWLP